MFIYPSQLMFLFFMISGTFISITSQSWFCAWMGLELNLLSFIPILSNYSFYQEQSSLKYFLVQAWASLLLFMTIMSFNYFSLYNNLIIQSLYLALMMKMGAAPFHFWVPMVCKGSTWLNLLILLTWQKLALIVLLNTLTYYSLMMLFFSSASALIGGIMGINQTNLRTLMAFSSINHLGWMIILAYINLTSLMTYFLIYCFISSTVIFSFYLFNLFTLKQMVNLPCSYFTKLCIFSNLLSLGGLPPFLGFLPKWFSLMEMLSFNFLLPSFILVMSSLLSLYYYLRLSMISFLLLPNTPKWNMKNFNTKIPARNMSFLLVISLMNFWLYPLLYFI